MVRGPSHQAETGGPPSPLANPLRSRTYPEFAGPTTPFREPALRKYYVPNRPPPAAVRGSAPLSRVSQICRPHTVIRKPALGLTDRRFPPRSRARSAFVRNLESRAPCRHRPCGLT